MWQLVTAMEGLADACQVLEVPVTGGNVSLYNETGQPGLVDSAIHPTPVVGVLGVLEDVTKAVPSGWRAPGLEIYLLGVTRAELGGSAWADFAHGHLGGNPPAVDLAAERALAQVLMGAARQGLAQAAHDLSDGGLATAMVESCLRFGVGAGMSLDLVMSPAAISPFEALFSESQGRALVAVRPGSAEQLKDLAARFRVPLAMIGLTGGDSLDVVWTVAADQAEPSEPSGGNFNLPLTELRAAHESTLPRHFA
jgi:phosphoribosylformylglycinamidine synthase